MGDRSEDDRRKQLSFPPEAAEEFLTQAPVGAGIVSVPSFHVTAANSLFGQLLGIDGPLNAPLPACLSDSMTASLLPLLDRAAAGATLREEIRVPEAGNRWVEIRLGPLHRDGVVHAVALLVADITAHKHADEELIESEMKARAAIETAVEGIITIDEEGIIESFNPAAARIFGYAPEEAIGQNVSILMPEPYRSQHTDFIRRYLATGQAHIIGIGREVIGQRKDGTLFPMDLAVSEVRLADHVHFTGLIRDITERKQAEAALRQAQRQAEEAYHREKQIAQRFQSTLLPREEERVPGYAIAHSYRPALVEADVGGDFYNLIEIDPRRVGVVVGDVGGKGLDAAVLAAQAQHTLMALLLQDPQHPERVLAEARRPITALDPDRILTVFLGVLERDTGRLRCASAGHEQPLLWHAAERRMEVLPLDGPAFFGIPAGTYSRIDTQLEEGDLLFLYTDGLPDACGDDGLLGLERVSDLVARNADRPPEVLLSVLYDSVIAYSYNRLRDDIVLMAIRRERARLEGHTVFVPAPGTPEWLEAPAALKG